MPTIETYSKLLETNMFDNPTIFETEGLSIDKSEQEFEEKTIPDWIKNNAKW